MGRVENFPVLTHLISFLFFTLQEGMPHGTIDQVWKHIANVNAEKKNEKKKEKLLTYSLERLNSLESPQSHASYVAVKQKV